MKRFRRIQSTSSLCFYKGFESCEQRRDGGTPHKNETVIILHANQLIFEKKINDIVDKKYIKNL